MRKSKDLIKVLKKKGFELNPDKKSHKFFSLIVDGKKQAVFTYLSHGKKDYDSNLMGQVKKQLKFVDSTKAEDFFDCPLSKEGYVEMLRDLGEV